MNIETWEMLTLDWSQKGDHGIVLSPSAVANLIHSKNLEQAYLAYDDISEATGINKVIYPCALSVIKTILAALPGCTGIAREKCLDLLGDIAGSESGPSSPNLHRDCLLELRQATWYFIYGLQFDDVKLASLYVDILGVLGANFDDFRPTARKYLELSLTRRLPEYDIAMIKNTIAELN